MENKTELTPTAIKELLQILKTRFERFPERHPDLKWEEIQVKLAQNPLPFKSVWEMEQTGGEPDVVIFPSGIYIVDCSIETPKGRRSLCYDQEALESRKTHKPADSAIHLSQKMGIELLNEEEYFEMQKLGKFDLKTSSWLKTPDEIRKLGGAIFGDRRFDRVFIYHNGAESYYSSRGFRGKLKL